MNWLFLTPRFPWPLVDGHWLRVYHLARSLRTSGDRVAVLSFRGEDGTSTYSEVGVDVIAGPAGGHISRGRARTLLGPYAFDQRFADVVSIHAQEFDAVVLSGSRMLQYAPEAAGSTCIIADLIDDPVLEYGRRGERPRGLRERARRIKNKAGRPLYERKFLSYVRITTFVSENDCESFRRRHPQACVACIPNGVDVDHFQPPENRQTDRETVPTLVFTGHMSNPNNERAATFLAREVAPLVWREHPDARVQIVGADPSAAVQDLADDRVEVTGRVDDIRPYLWNATAVVLPMQSGTGIKNKLLEAWAAAAPVVATPLACQGVAARDGDNLLIGHDAADVSAKVVQLLGSSTLRRQLAENGHQTVAEIYTWQEAARRLRNAALPRCTNVEKP